MTRLWISLPLAAAMLGSTAPAWRVVQAAGPLAAVYGNEADDAADQAADEADGPAADESTIVAAEDSVDMSDPADAADGASIEAPSTDEADDEQADGSSSAEQTAPGDREVEVIRERYPNRAIKVEREVTQDQNGNYVNHGAWRMWDAKGTLIVEGHYNNGERNGVWNRWYRAGEVELLTKPPYNGFQGPFISQATFHGGKLDGKWNMFDGKQHKISEWQFVEGDRHGKSTWWYTTGRKMRDIEYTHGEIDGQLLEWSPDGQLVTKDTYQQGRKLAARSEKHSAGGGKKTEGLYLFAKEVVRTPDDWWDCHLAVYVKQGKDEKHGPWVAWYPNGQKQAEGEYRSDVQVGRFSWWYANGQKALEGGYADGEQEGRWVWWYESGQKSIQGEYAKGNPVGRWTWWHEDGKIARSSEMEQGAGEVVHMPKKLPQSSAARPAGMPAQPTYRATR